MTSPRYAVSHYTTPMTHDVEQWFSNPNCGADWQNMDLVLAQPENLPRLKAYLIRPSSKSAA